MNRPVHLTSADNPRVKAVVRLRKARERRKQGAFVAEGLREVSRAFDAGLEAHLLCTCDALLDDAARQAVGQLIASRDVAHCTASEAVFRKMAYQQHPQGVLGVFATHRWTVADLPAAKDELWLVAVGLSKPGNLGALARCADAAGATALLIVDGVADVYNPNALRNSTGAVLTLPILDADTPGALDLLRQRGVRIVAAALERGRGYTDIDLTPATALVIGAEDAGLPAAWRDAADAVATIPMRGRTADSLNASVAGALLLYEALRQRAR